MLPVSGRPQPPGGVSFSLALGSADKVSAHSRLSAVHPLYLWPYLGCFSAVPRPYLGCISAISPLIPLRLPDEVTAVRENGTLLQSAGGGSYKVKLPPSLGAPASLLKFSAVQTWRPIPSRCQKMVAVHDRPHTHARARARTHTHTHARARIAR